MISNLELIAHEKEKNYPTNHNCWTHCCGPFTFHGVRGICECDPSNNSAPVNSPNPATGSSITTTAGTYSGSIGNMSFLPETISPYAYVYDKISGGQAKASDVSGNGASGATVEIVIALSLKTPSGRQVEMNFSPNKLTSTGAKDIVMVLGPDELNHEVGTFQMTLTITIKVTVPVVGNVVDLNLTPVNLTFQVPA